MEFDKGGDGFAGFVLTADFEELTKEDETDDDDDDVKVSRFRQTELANQLGEEKYKGGIKICSDSTNADEGVHVGGTRFDKARNGGGKLRAETKENDGGQD